MNKLMEKQKWKLADTDIQSQNYGKSFVFDFTVFESQEICNVVKAYVLENYRTKNRTPRGLREFLRRITIINKFFITNEIYSLTELNNNVMDELQTFLRTYISARTKKPLSYETQRGILSSLKSLIGWCRVFMPDSVPSQQLFAGNEYSNSYGNRVSIEFIPDEILSEINAALDEEENTYLKCGMQILECTGMRLGDLLLLKTDCISESPVTGYTISWFDHKNRHRMEHLPVPKKCVDAVNEIITLTENIRKEAEVCDSKYLFIYKPSIGTNKTPIVKVSRQVFTKWCAEFSLKHNICDSSGNVFKLTTHMFRRTLATDMLSKGVGLNAVQEVMGHKSPATTKTYYADVKNPERAEMFNRIGIIGNIHSIDETVIRDEEDLLWFKNNCNGRARLSDGYCTMPIQNGEPCGRYLSRQKCYLCNRYITTLEDLDIHKAHLKELQDTLNSNIYGEHFAAHIIPVITVLKEIIQRLEAMRDEK